jgi:hypothetical protein
MPEIIMGIDPEGDVVLQFPVHGTEDTVFVVKVDPSAAIMMGNRLIAYAEEAAGVKELIAADVMGHA